MQYLYYVFILMLIFFGGSVMSVIAAVSGIAMIFYLSFKWGPKLGLIAIPVSICFFLCVTLEDFVWMYAKHFLLFVLLCPVATAAVCHYYYEEGYKRIVIGVTAGFLAVTMGVLAIWMNVPREFPVPEHAVKVEIQKMDEGIQAVYTDPKNIGELMEKLERVEMRGSFKELTELTGTKNTYRLTFLNNKGKNIGTYYFLSKYYIAKPIIGDHLLFYRWTEDSQFPYQYLVNMYDYAVQLSQ